MLHAMLMALTLEGVLPALRRVRRPVAVVRYDRVREPRIRANLRRIARHLSHSADAAVAVAFADCRVAETRSGGASTGARIVLFSET
jgi:hypothetical protein